MIEAEHARGCLVELLRRMGVEAEVDVAETDESIRLDVKGPETGLVIGRQGQTLDALQLVVSKMVYGPSASLRDGKPVVIDAEGYRERREQSLVEMARRLAEKAVRSNRQITLQPMSAHDRRVVHLALQEYQGVTTRSEGEGANRRLMIIPESGG